MKLRVTLAALMAFTLAAMLPTPSMADPLTVHTVSGHVTWQLARDTSDDPPGFTLAWCTRACVRDIDDASWWLEDSVAASPEFVNPGEGTSYSTTLPEGTYVPAVRFNSGFGETWYGGYLQAAADGTWRLTQDYAAGTPVSVDADMTQDFEVHIPWTDPGTGTEPEEPPAPHEPRIRYRLKIAYVIYNDASYGGWKFYVRRARPDMTMRIRLLGCGGKTVASRTVTGRRGSYSFALAPSPRRLGPKPRMSVRVTQPGHQTKKFTNPPETLKYWPASRRQFTCRR